MTPPPRNEDCPRLLLMRYKFTSALFGAVLLAACGGATPSPETAGGDDKYGPPAAAPPVAALLQPGPVADSTFAPVNEPDFGALMKATSAEKEAVMRRQLALLN